MAGEPQISRVPDAEAAAHRAAELLAAAIDGARTIRGVAHVALSGGTTPRRAYELLGPMLRTGATCTCGSATSAACRPTTPSPTPGWWPRRSTRPGPSSHRIRGELGAEAAAAAYGEELGGDDARRRAAGPRRGRPHRLAVPRASRRCARRAWRCRVHDAPKPPPERVTLTLGKLNDAPPDPAARDRARASASRWPACWTARTRPSPPRCWTARAWRSSPTTPRSAMAEVWLVRHAETEWSANGRHTGPHRHPAHPRRRGGRAGARAAPGRPPLRAASSSARSAARGRPPSSPASAAGAEVREELREWDYGDYEGITTPDIRRERPALVAVARRRAGRGVAGRRRGALRPPRRRAVRDRGPGERRRRPLRRPRAHPAGARRPAGSSAPSTSAATSC